MPISKRLSPENIRRVQRLEDALEDLRDGNSRYFSITKLTSIKSLCKDDYFRKEYCVYLATLVLNKSKALAGKDGAERIIELIQSAHRIIINIANDSSNKNVVAAREILSQLRGFQDQYIRVKWSTVRIINDKDILILEDILQSLLTQTDNAASYAYDATRTYVEKYDPLHGTGLVVESIPMLEKIVYFWKEYEVQ
jgi:hypothetical protein